MLPGDSFDIWQVATNEDKTAVRRADIEIQITGVAEKQRKQQTIGGPFREKEGT